jgi:hypothetical protein
MVCAVILLCHKLTTQAPFRHLPQLPLIQQLLPLVPGLRHVTWLVSQPEPGHQPFLHSAGDG